MKYSLFGKKLTEVMEAADILYVARVEHEPKKKRMRLLMSDGGTYELKYRRIQLGILDELDRERKKRAWKAKLKKITSRLVRV